MSPKKITKIKFDNLPSLQKLEALRKLQNGELEWQDNLSEVEKLLGNLGMKK